MNHKPIVYLIDDDIEIIKSLSIFFSMSDYQLIAFDSAIDYLDRVSHVEMMGCLISDIVMDSMDGLELQRRLNKIGCIQPTIFITGHGSVDMAIQAMKLGAFDFIQKPFDPEILLEKVVEANKMFKDKMENLSRYQTLTNSEDKVFKQVVLGLKNKDIAERLCISIPTVEAHRSRVMHKMSVESLADLVKISLYVSR
jgi:FixJ family two-component response regulator